MEFLIIPPDPATVAVQQSQSSPSAHVMPASVKYGLRFSVILHVSVGMLLNWFIRLRFHLRNISKIWSNIFTPWLYSIRPTMINFSLRFILKSILAWMCSFNHFYYFELLFFFIKTCCYDGDFDKLLDSNQGNHLHPSNTTLYTHRLTKEMVLHYTILRTSRLHSRATMSFKFPFISSTFNEDSSRYISC